MKESLVKISRGDVVEDVFLCPCSILDVRFIKIIREILIAEIEFKTGNGFEEIYDPDSLVGVARKELDVFGRS